jgi:ribosomal protein S18 acetylase RimI-like enzyme
MIIRDEIRYESTKYSRIFTATLEDAGESVGAFMAFTYGSSLRFKVVLATNVGDDDFNLLRRTIDEYRSAVPADDCLFWFTVLNEGVNRRQISLVEGDEGSYYFRQLSIGRSAMSEFCRVERKCGAPVIEYRPELLDACIAILESAFTPVANPPGSFIREREIIDRELRPKASAKCLVLLSDEEPIGLAKYAEGVLDYLAVAEGYRGRGYGEYLLQRLFAYALANTEHDLRLFCREDNADALRFYERLGFKTESWSARVTLQPSNS